MLAIISRGTSQVAEMNKCLSETPGKKKGERNAKDYSSIGDARHEGD